MARATLQRHDELLTLEVHGPTLPTRLAQYGRVVRNALDELYKSKTACIGAMMLVVLFAACLLTPYIDRYSPIKQNAQFIGLCSSLKWSRHLTKSPFLALPATAGSNAAYKIISACSNAVS